MRLLLLLLFAPLLATFAPTAMIKKPAAPPRPTIRAEPVPLRDDDPAARRLGRLTFLEGWWLRADHPEFGGLSAMHVAEGQVLALSDGGVVMRFPLPKRSGSAPLWMLHLPDAPGRNKKQRDTEAMAVHGGRAWIAFERANAVFRYWLSSWRSDADAAPAAMRRWPLNSGSEAMVRLRDGRFLVFSEGQERPDGSTEALLFDGDPALEETRSATLGYRAPAGFRITDAAELPDGRLLFLNRRLSLTDGFVAKLTLAPKPTLREGLVLEGREIASFAPPVTTDNYEALSVGEESGRTIVWIASDDNFIALERTLLMKFALN
jgi:hypothetical protein